MKKLIVLTLATLALTACTTTSDPGEWKRSNLYLDQAVSQDGEIVWRQWPTKYNTKTGDLRVVLPEEMREEGAEE